MKSKQKKSELYVCCCDVALERKLKEDPFLRGMRLLSRVSDIV